MSVRARIASSAPLNTAAITIALRIGVNHDQRRAVFVRRDRVALETCFKLRLEHRTVVFVGVARAELVTTILARLIDRSKELLLGLYEAELEG